MANPLDVLKKKDETLATKKVAAFEPSKYKGFGSEAGNAYKEGWMAGEPLSLTQRVYTNPYTLALSQVQIPGDQRAGHMALIGNDNGYFDVAIRNADGKILQKPMQQVPYAQARQYLANQIQGRINNIQSGKVASTVGDATALNR